MIEFINFARDYGLILNNVIYDKWVATPTEDHPRSSNGRYKLLGNVGWVQNWATMEKPVTWFADGINQQEVKQRIKESNDDRQIAAKKAANKAEWILSQTSLEGHPYLERKGFPNELGNVWIKDDRQILVVPMRHQERIMGLQLINDEGEKKFLYGQTSKGATFTMNAKGTPIFCEGFATGLSIRDIMQSMNLPYCIHICFSASNMQFVARNIRSGIVIADHDSNGVGERFAKDTGKPYWLSETVGEDFNDYHMRVGKFKASQALKKMLIASKNGPQSV
jgi:putative DNA primase/helicase